MLNDKNERELAYVVEISEIRPIEGADKIELAIVNHWQAIVPKGSFRVGDKAVFIEHDALLPKRLAVQFGVSRIKTRKLRGVVSQGLLCSIEELFADTPKEMFAVGSFLTDVLDITYYTDKEQGSTDAFPTDLPYLVKTNEERIENCYDKIPKNKVYIATEKLDGSSTTFLVRRKGSKGDYSFEVFSHNTKRNDVCGDIFWEMARKYDIKYQMIDYATFADYEYFAIQGETIGAKIQKNPYHMTDRDFYVFNAVSNEGKFSWYNLKQACFFMNLKLVPSLGADILPSTFEECKKQAKFTSCIANVPAEGIVYRDVYGDIHFKNVAPVIKDIQDKQSIDNVIKELLNNDKYIRISDIVKHLTDTERINTQSLSQILSILQEVG